MRLKSKRLGNVISFFIFISISAGGNAKEIQLVIDGKLYHSIEDYQDSRISSFLKKVWPHRDEKDLKELYDLLDHHEDKPLVIEDSKSLVDKAEPNAEGLHKSNNPDDVLKIKEKMSMIHKIKSKDVSSEASSKVITVTDPSAH